MADVFISYARGDQAVARRAAKALQAAGYEVWWDADLPAHRAYSEVIERNLVEAKAVLVLWSATAARSQWVRAEADLARNRGTLVQGAVDGAVPPLPFNQIQCADLRKWRGGGAHAGWNKLLASIESLVAGDRPASPRSEPPRLWTRLTPYRWVAAALLALVFAASLFLVFRPAGEERRPILAVLPFRSLDAQDASLVAGIWEDTRTAIGRNPQLVVLGPNSAQQLADKGEEAARKAADYLLQASVRTAGDRVRVSVDLVRTKDGGQVWAQDFDRKLDDVFALQSEIAGEIEGRIRGRLAERGGVTPEHIATSGDAYALYSDARAKIRKRGGPEDYAAAHNELKQVLKIDPNYAPAWSALSQIVTSLAPSQNGWKLTDSSEAYARKAIELAPNLAAGHAALALALHFKGPVARTEVERAVQLDPSDYEAATWLGNVRKEAGDSRGAAEAYRRAAQIEPFFWPAVLNLYSTLRDLHDQQGMRELVEQENRLGADYLGTAIGVEKAFDSGNLAEAVNIGLAYWKTGREEARPAIAADVWSSLILLGFIDEATKLGPGPDFAPALWRLDPKGLDLMESHHIDAQTFFTLEPLTENAGRAYLLNGRSKAFADRYLLLKLTPEGFFKLARGDHADDHHFLYTAPLIAAALKQIGAADKAQALLALAEVSAKKQPAATPLNAVLLARIYAVQGRSDDAIDLLTSAISRGFIPEAPELLADLGSDPAFATLKGNPRFEQQRQRLLGTIARERAQVNLQLLAQLRTA